MSTVRRLRLAAATVATFAIVAMACSSTGPSASTSTTIAPSGTTDTTDTTSTTIEPGITGAGFRTRTSGVLVVGTERLSAPWFTGPSAGVVTGGLEYRLAQEIGARLGVPTIRVVPTSLVLMMTGQDCRCDVVIGGVTITDGRARTLDLTEPYLDADQALLVRRGTSVATLAAAAGLRLAAAVRDPAAFDVIRTRIKPTSETLAVAAYDEALRRMADGRVDGIVLDVPDALALTLADPSLTVAGRIRTGEQYAVALSLGSPNTALVNDVIDNMRADGTISNLVSVYLKARPEDVPELP